MRSQCGKYQEQPQLLDPHLEGILSPLTDVLRRAARAAAAVGADSADATAAATADLASSQRVCRLLQLLATLRGAKTVAKFFPHGAADLEPALALLRASDASRGARGEDPEGTGAWEVRCCAPLPCHTHSATRTAHASVTQQQSHVHSLPPLVRADALGAAAVAVHPGAHPV